MRSLQEFQTSIAIFSTMYHLKENVVFENMKGCLALKYINNVLYVDALRLLTPQKVHN